MLQVKQTTGEERARFKSRVGAAFAIFVPLVPSKPSCFSAEPEQDSLPCLPQKGVGGSN